PSVFAPALEDVCAVEQVVRGSDPSDGYSLSIPRGPARAPRIAAPRQIESFGDAGVAALYDDLRARLPGADDLDLDQFRSLNDLMFFGPFLAERDASVGAFISANPEACDPTVRNLVLSSRKFTAAQAYEAQYAVADCRAALAPFWQNYDVLLTPTVGAIVTRDMVAQDPLGPNFNNGYYTNFANPLGLAAISVPIARAPCGTPWGVTLYSLPERMETLI
ncbi:MAG: amidase family protein, partial [Mangrovicoccus sp.]|nr:amidase family protein [Mangrovicoccus sp.]